MGLECVLFISGMAAVDNICVILVKYFIHEWSLYQQNYQATTEILWLQCIETQSF